MSANNETLLLSATQISLVSECERKWALAYICGLKSPQTPAQALGQAVDDGQLQPYLKFGRPFDDGGVGEDGKTRPCTEAGKIAAAGLKYLPPPRYPGLEAQKRFVIPAACSKPGSPAPFAYQGYLDIWLPEGGMPTIPIDGFPVVADSKTTKNKRYAKTETTLKTDTQAMLYAVWAMYQTKKRTVHLDWVYFMTDGSYGAFERKATVVADEVFERFLEIDKTGEHILKLWGGAPKGGDDEAKLAYALSLPPNPRMCGEYGGCPHRHICNLGPGEITGDELTEDQKRRLPVMGSTLDLFGSLKKAADEQDGVAVGINPPRTQADPPPPAPEPEVAAPPVEEAPKAKRGRKPKVETTVTVPLDSVCESGFEFEVVWGREARSPEAGEGYEVGPFSAKGRTNPGESLVDAMYRVHAQLQTLATMCRADRKASFEKGSE